MFKVIIGLFYFALIIQLFIFFESLSKLKMTPEKDSILIDIIKNNPQDDYISISVINDLSPNVFKTLLEAGLHIKTNQFNQMSLHQVIDDYKSDYLVMYIIYNNPESIFEQNIYYEYPLHRAIERKFHLDVINELRNKAKQLMPEYQFIIENQVNRDNKTIFELIALNY
jgi:hypothetical protein